MGEMEFKMKNYKKLTLWFLILNILYLPYLQADSSDVSWEHYIPVATVTLLAGVYGYSLCSPNQDLKNQSQCKYWGKDFTDKYKIYYPTEYSILDYFYQDELQVIANEAHVPVVVILESYVKHNPDDINMFFEHVQSFAPCIVYIEKDMSNFTAWPFYDFNTFIDDTDNYFQRCCSQLMIRLRALQENTENVIVVFGIGQQHDRQSEYDISYIGFNITYEKPSYKERIEFLNLLFLHRPNSCFEVEEIAKKTIGFSYMELITLVKKSEQNAAARYTTEIDYDDLNKACTEMISIHAIGKYISIKSLYETCVHEMGHAIMAAHFNEDFILHNVTSTPQSNVDDPTATISLGITSYCYACNVMNDIEFNKKRIMIALSGKITEQIFFGLSNHDVLNNQTGYIDFIENPDGADSDLSHALNCAHKIYEINQKDPDETLKELYGQTLDLLLTYKSKIEIGAKLLEQHEFLTGSQVYNLL